MKHNEPSGLFCRLNSAYLLIQQERMVGRLENPKAFIRCASFHICFEQKPNANAFTVERLVTWWGPLCQPTWHLAPCGARLGSAATGPAPHSDLDRAERQRRWREAATTSSPQGLFSFSVCVCFTCCLSGILPSACPNNTKVWLWQTLRRGIRWVKNEL